MSSKYIPRLTAPSSTDKDWISTQYGGYNECIVINRSTGACIPNCVGYAWGRWREILGRRPNLSTGNAENWYGHTSDGYKRGKSPKLGAVICWRSGIAGKSSDGYGHVMVVEAINGNKITCSGSDYSGRRFYTKEISGPAYNFSSTSKLKFQGFIYNPIEFDESDDFLPPRGYFRYGDRDEKIGQISSFMRATFPAYTPRAALGNYFGKNLLRSVMEFQRRTGLDPDGNIGPLTLAELEKYGFQPK